MLLRQRPARDDQVAIPAHFEAHIVLIEYGGGIEPFAQQLRLIVVARAADVVVDFLETNQVRARDVR